MIFEFTREQREAWRVFRPIALEKWLECALEDFDAAAARFDAREATCGIEPLSAAHHFLGALEAYPDTIKSVAVLKKWEILYKNGLMEWKDAGWWDITDRGREVLAALNAMCKVQA